MGWHGRLVAAPKGTDENKSSLSMGYAMVTLWLQSQDHNGSIDSDRPHSDIRNVLFKMQ